MKTAVGIALLMPLLAIAQTTTPVTCTTGTLTGAHSLTLNGRNSTASAILSKVFVSVGTATFDGSGGVTFNLTTSGTQGAGLAQTMTGTYSLPTNCLGTLTITTGDSASYTLIPYNSGKNFSIAGQDATYTLAGTGGIAPTTCPASSFSGSYAFTGNGFALAAGAVTGVDAISGLLQFDGVGTVTGSWSVATNGVATPAAVTGTYTSSPNCTASATVNDAGGNSFSLYFSISTADAANFDLLIGNAGNVFSATGHSTFTYPGLAVELAAGTSLTVPAGSLFSIYGFGLTSGKGAATQFPLPFTLANATVTVNGEQVPLYAVDNTALGAEGLINAQMPLDIQPGVATLVVKNGTAVSNSVAINIPATAQPGVFVYGSNHAVAQNFPSYALNSASAQANVGDTVIVYFTGGGPVQGGSVLKSGGQTPSASFQVTEDVTATIAGVNATVGYVGLVPTTVGGFYQANIVIPKVAAGDRNLILTVGGKASAATLISVN